MSRRKRKDMAMSEPTVNEEAQPDLTVPPETLSEAQPEQPAPPRSNEELCKALLKRCAQGWQNAIELGLLHHNYHHEARQIIRDIEVALTRMGSP